MKWLVTGGAGFIGCNMVKSLLDLGESVIILDNLSRMGTEINLKWLELQGEFNFIKGDIRNFDLLKSLFMDHKDIDVVLHLAAQVAVTTSVQNPREDFEVNALGTFNICEAIRLYKPEAILLYSSTNKVYGQMNDVTVIENNDMYEYLDFPNGISEKHSMDFHSPYGCSKGAGDQYVMDYSRLYGIKSVSFRQSCIYGDHQFGVEDQGWVAWFAICSVLGNKITIYGDGKQVRDILHVKDLINCYLKAIDNIEKTSGNAYNIGGGPKNKMSLLELINVIENLSSINIKYEFSNWRPGDQKVFVCDIQKANSDFGWEPNINTLDGVKFLYEWVSKNKNLFQ